MLVFVKDSSCIFVSWGQKNRLKCASILIIYPCVCSFLCTSMCFFPWKDELMYVCQLQHVCLRQGMTGRFQALMLLCVPGPRVDRCSAHAPVHLCTNTHELSKVAQPKLTQEWPEHTCAIQTWPAVKKLDSSSRHNTWRDMVHQCRLMISLVLLLRQKKWFQIHENVLIRSNSHYNHKWNWQQNVVIRK